MRDIIILSCLRKKQVGPPKIGSPEWMLSRLRLLKLPIWPRSSPWERAAVQLLPDHRQLFGRRCGQLRGVWVVKTSHIHKFNNLATESFSSHQIKFSHGSAAPAPPRMGCCCVPFPRGPDPRKPCPASATAGSPRQTTSRSEE